MQYTMYNLDTTALSNGISNLTVRIKEQEDGSFVTMSAGKYYPVIVPSIIACLILGILLITGSYVEFGVKNYMGLVLFVSVFGVMMYFFQRIFFQPYVFDFKNMICYKKGKQVIDLNKVEAIQVLVYHHSVSGNNKIRYEINLVSITGKRIHLFNNANYLLVKEQARFLASELGCIIKDETHLAF